MGQSSSIIPYLFLATFAIVIVYGVWQFFKAKKAKAEGQTSASTRQGKPAGGHSSSSAAAPTTTAGASSASPKDPPIVPR